MDLAYRVIDGILLASVALVPGLYAFKLGPRSVLNRLFFLICLWLVVRITSTLLVIAIIRELGQIVTLFKINFFFHATFFSLNLHFFLRLRAKKSLPAWTLAAIYLPMLALCVIAALDYRKFVDFVLRCNAPPRVKSRSEVLWRAWPYTSAA
jgi:hypothetical protein